MSLPRIEMIKFSILTLTFKINKIMFLDITLVIYVVDIIHIFLNRIEIIRFWTLTFKVKVMKIMFLCIILVMHVVDVSDVSHIVGYG